MGEELHTMKYFAYDHLPPYLQEISKPFAELANQVYNRVTCDVEERDVAIRKLLEAKDAAVRAALA